MQIYYWEAENARGQIKAANDDDALRQLRNLVGLMVVYRETGDDEDPLYVVWRGREMAH